MNMRYKFGTIIALTSAVLLIVAAPSSANATTPVPHPNWTLGQPVVSGTATATPDDEALCHATAYKPYQVTGPSGYEIEYTGQQVCEGDYYSQKMCVALQGVDALDEVETLTSFYCVTTAGAKAFAGRTVLCTEALEAGFSQFLTLGESDVEDEAGIQSGEGSSSEVTEGSVC